MSSVNLNCLASAESNMEKPNIIHDYSKDKPTKSAKPATPTTFQRPVPCKCVRTLDTDALHVTPTVSIMAVVGIFTAISSYFVSEYIVDIVRTEAVFAVGSYIVFASYFMLHYYLLKFSSSYNAVTQEKHFYVISNLIKSAMLAAMTPFALHLLYQVTPI